MTSPAAELIAEKIRNADASGNLIAPIKDELTEATVDEAYRVQRINTAWYLEQGRFISGRKIGLTSPAVQKQLGVDQPDFGVLWKDTEYQDGQEIPYSKLHQPKIECEIALVLGQRIDVPRPGIADVMRAVDYVVPALEVVGSRIADWKISIMDTIADNASSGVYVLGGPPRKLDGLDLRLCGMVMERDGQPVSTGCGAACLGHPLHAAVWLAQTMVERGMPLDAGDIVLTGALGPMVNVNPGDVFTARINGLGSVRASFTGNSDMSNAKTKVAVIGSGNIGTDLMIKVLRTSDVLEMSVLVGIDPQSDGLARAGSMGVATTHDGIDGLVAMPEFQDIKVVFDATSAAAHQKHDAILREHHKQIIDLTPAAIGPYTIPVVNLDEHLSAPNVNMVTCGGQATIPMVAAVGRVHPVVYGEIVASISSKSAGPGTRANIDEFTVTTARAIEQVGGAKNGKAIIILNPAEPPLLMRNTVMCLVDGAADRDAVERSVSEMVADVQAYVSGYRLKQQVQFDSVAGFSDPRVMGVRQGTKVTIFLEVEGAAHYLPAYAGNLDIMTSAALKTAERIIELRGQELAV